MAASSRRSPGMGKVSAAKGFQLVVKAQVAAKHERETARQMQDHDEAMQREKMREAANEASTWFEHPCFAHLERPFVRRPIIALLALAPFLSAGHGGDGHGRRLERRHLQAAQAEPDRGEAHDSGVCHAGMNNQLSAPTQRQHRTSSTPRWVEENRSRPVTHEWRCAAIRLTRLAGGLPAAAAHLAVGNMTFSTARKEGHFGHFPLM